MAVLNQKPVEHDEAETTTIGRVGDARARANRTREVVPAAADSLQPFDHHDTIPAPPAWLDDNDEPAKS